MGAIQIASMEPSVREVYKGISSSDDPPTSCCTFETRTRSGLEVWIQVMPGTINMSFPFDEEPLDLLRRKGVRSPLDLHLVDWGANEYATFGFDNLPARDHAFFVDQLFVKILGCDDESYEVSASIEPLET